MWVAMTLVGFVATGVIKDDHLQKGNPNRLIYPMDYNGDLCGISDSVKNKRYGYFMPDKTGNISTLHVSRDAF